MQTLNMFINITYKKKSKKKKKKYKTKIHCERTALKSIG